MSQLRKQRNHETPEDERIAWTQMCLSRCEEEIRALVGQGAIAPKGTWVAKYQVNRKYVVYWYWKLQSKKPIFKSRDGKHSRYVHLGTDGSKSFLLSVAAVTRRNQLDVLLREREIYAQALSNMGVIVLSSLEEHLPIRVFDPDKVFDDVREHAREQGKLGTVRECRDE